MEIHSQEAGWGISGRKITGRNPFYQGLAGFYTDPMGFLLQAGRGGQTSPGGAGGGAEGPGQTLRVGVLANSGLEDTPKDGLAEKGSE